MMILALGGAIAAMILAQWGIQAVRAPDEPCREVVGVTEDLRINRLDSEPFSAVYFLPRAQAGTRGGMLLLRAGGGRVSDIAASVSETLRVADTSVPFIQTLLLRDFVRPQLRPWRLGAILFSAFGILALLLSIVGLYGVLSYEFTQRKR